MGKDFIEKNVNSGWGNIYVDIGGKQKHKEKKNKVKNIICCILTGGSGLFLSNLHPLTPPLLQSPARSAIGSPVH